MSQGSSPSVLIAGAGLAGLAAAHALQQEGARVIVIEARPRVGGRVWTIRDGFEGEQHAEAGGDLIDEGQEEIQRLIRDLGLELVPILDGGFGFVSGDPRGGAPRLEPAGRTWTTLVELLRRQIRQYRLIERRWDSAVVRALARTSVSQWLDEIDADESLRARMRGLRGFFLADPEQLSLLALVDQIAMDPPGQGRMYRIRGGNDQLPQRLAAQLDDGVRLRAALVAIHQSADRIRATVREADDTHSVVTADYAILALPATLVRTIAFVPPLPPVQHQAIARLAYGRATKTLLQCSNRFWAASGRPRAFGTDLPIGAVWDGNEEQPGTPGILTLLAGASASEQTQKLVADGGVGRLMQALEWLGASSARLIGSRQIVWEDEPWSGGGYAYFDPTYDPSWRRHLAEPHGRIFFAGEHTSFQWQGYMNGAVESGLRAAAEVLALCEERAGPRMLLR